MSPSRSLTERSNVRRVLHCSNTFSATRAYSRLLYSGYFTFLKFFSQNYRNLSAFMKCLLKPILLFILFLMAWSCSYKCTEGSDKYQIDFRTGKKKIVKSTKFEFAILTKRCKTSGCRAKATHCHKGFKYRGMPWYKKQNPKIGEVDQYGNF